MLHTQQQNAANSKQSTPATSIELICSQDYLGIVDFLTALPLKSREERRDFFGGLTRRLYSVPEETVAIQGYNRFDMFQNRFNIRTQLDLSDFTIKFHFWRCHDSTFCNEPVTISGIA